MLMAQAFSSLLNAWDRGELSAVPTTLIVDEVIVSLYQVLVRTLMAQNSNGSFGSSDSREVTAYATLTISKASVLPFAAPLGAQIKKAIAAAHEFLLSTTELAPSYLWVEKVTYGSMVLAESYVLAALNASMQSQLTFSSQATSLATIPLVDVECLYETCFKSPLFSLKESWKVHAAFIESFLYRPYLERLAKDGAAAGKENDKAFEVIPFVWTAYNYSGTQFLTTSKLRQNIGICLLEELTHSSAKVAKTVHKGAATNENGNGIEFVNGSLKSTTSQISKGGQAYARALTGASTVTHVPYELTYLLPDGATSNLHDTFVQSTTTSNVSINSLLSVAAKSVFTAYDSSFAQVVGPNVSAKLVVNRPGSGAFYELGAYIPTLNEVWFTSTFDKYDGPQASFEG